MSPDKWYIDGCLKASAEDVALFEKWTAHLPKREEYTPYHSDAHSIKQFRHALSLAGFMDRYQPFNVVEIGFCLGHSAEIFLQLGAHQVTSIETSDRTQTVEARNSMWRKWREKFQFLSRDEAEIYHTVFGAVFEFGFIDGDHSAEAIRRDISLMRHYQVEWALFDDFWPHWGDTQQVMQELGITPVAILGTMALCDFR